MSGPWSFVSDQAGVRLDVFLTERLKDLSRGFIRRAIEEGCVSVNGGVSKPPGYRMRLGDRVEVVFKPPAWGAPGDFERRVLHEDQDLLVLDKPAGILMHPMGTSWLKSPGAALAEGEPNLVGILLLARPDIGSSGVPRAGLVHRLDRQTSGVLIVAKTVQAHQAMTEAFRDREVRKLYRAIVAGRVVEDHSEVSAPVSRQRGRKRPSAHAWGRESQTSFRVVERGPRATLLEASPLTGRTHQIRIHLALSGHPVLGDPDHAGSPGPPFPRPGRMMLHASKVEFRHPRSGRRVAFESPVPSDFADYWKAVRRWRP